MVIKERIEEKMCFSTTKQTSKSNMVSPKTHQMGGLINAQDGKEAWTGGKPDASWSGLDLLTSQIPVATQICLKNSKAAVAKMKHTIGLYTKETQKVQT